MRADVGFVLTIVYIVVTIISPEQFGPEWATYHALTYLCGNHFPVFTFEYILRLSNTLLKSSIQTYLMFGIHHRHRFIGGTANGWIGGAIVSWEVFLPSAAVFFFVVANVTTIKKLKILTLAAVGSCLVVVVEALCGYYGGFRGDTFVLQQSLPSPGDTLGQLARVTWCWIPE